MGRLTARWGAALRIARRDALRHRGRTALVLAMIALPVFGAVFLVTVMQSSTPGPAAAASSRLGPAAQARIADTGCAPYLQTPRGSGGCDGAGTEGLTADALAGALPGREVVDERVAMLDVGTDSRLAPMQHGVVLDADALSAVFVAADGHLPTSPGEVAISRSLADRLGVGVGDAVELALGEERIDAEVTGILRARNLPSTNVVTVRGGPADPPVTGWYVLGDEPVTWDDVLAVNELGGTVDSRAVILDPPPRGAVPAYEWGLDDGVGLADSAATVGIVAAVVAMGLLEVILLVGPAFAVGARRSGRQLALVAAAGGAPRDTRRMVLASGLVLGLAAGVIGSALGLIGGAIPYAVAARTDSSRFPNLVLPWAESLGAVALAALLGLAAAWIPARGAARADVVAALAGRRSEARPRRAVPWVGTGIAGLGLLTAIAGAVLTQTVALMAGVVILEIGLVMAAGGIVTLVGRLAGRLGLAGRIAARDAARQRGRTAPAVAAVLAAVAGATAGAMYFAADQQREQAAWEQQLGIGTIALSSAPMAGSPLTQERLDADVDALERHIPIEHSTNVYLLTGAEEPDTAHPLYGAAPGVWASPEADPEQACPLETLGDAATPEQRAEYEDDPRCDGRWGYWSSGAPWHLAGGSGVVVDDGTAVALWGMPGDDEAAAALARGEALVADGRYVWSDGNAHVSVQISDDTHPDGARTFELVLPGHVVDWDRFAFVLPRSVVEEHDELRATWAGIVAQPVEAPTQAQIDAVRAELRDLGPGSLHVQQQYQSFLAVTLLAVVGVAALIGLGATWMSVGLAAAESRPDLATLSAVGASPRTRRRVAGAQAGIVAGIGVALGVLTGVLLGWVLVLWQRSTAVSDGRGDWVLVWPWPALAAVALGLPLLAIAGAWLTTPSRLPLVRRLAQ